jgi:hypothetical protein
MFIFGIVGVGAELILLEHTETVWQLVPLLTLSAGFTSALIVAARPTRPAVRVLQAITFIFLAAGVIGLVLHYRGNMEFELEMYPDLGGYALFRESMMGATPALAPGAMFLLGMIGLTFTFRHPLLRSNTVAPEDQPEEAP